MEDEIFCVSVEMIRTLILDVLSLRYLLDTPGDVSSRHLDVGIWGIWESLRQET